MDGDIIVPRVKDMLYLAENDGVAQFLGFLREEEASVALSSAGKNAFLYGGYDGAERTLLCVYPEWLEREAIEFPITAITLKYRKSDILAHKDFLGALMSLGIKRETVGDILITEGKAVVFLSEDIAGYVINELHTIGRVGVSVSRGIEGELPCASKKQTIRSTVASHRLDCVVAALCNLSRSSADELLRDGRVMLNSIITEKATKTISVGDKLTVRGYGKYEVTSTEGVTRKGRSVIVVEKYT